MTKSRENQNLLAFCCGSHHLIRTVLYSFVRVVRTHAHMYIGMYAIEDEFGLVIWLWRAITMSHDTSWGFLSVLPYYANIMVRALP